MVSVEELENIELNDSTEIRINPGMVGGAETFTVLVASEAGDQAMTMTKQELTNELTSNQGNWLFVDGQMVDAATIANTELSQDNVLRLVPSIVGGSETFTVQITDSTGHSVCEMTKEDWLQVQRKPTTGCLSTARWLLQVLSQRRTFLRRQRYA